MKFAKKYINKINNYKILNLYNYYIYINNKIN